MNILDSFFFFVFIKLYFFYHTKNMQNQTQSNKKP